jgi:6-phosphofructokinase 1
MVLVKEKIKDPNKEFKVTTLGHIQRGGNPTARDRVLASRCGMAAVEGLIEGKTNCMAGVMNSQVVYTPFADCIGKSKHLIPDHIKLIDILSIRYGVYSYVFDFGRCLYAVFPDGKKHHAA